MRKISIFLLAFSLVVGLGSAWADPLSRLSVTAEVSIPVNPPAVTEGETLPPGAADTFSLGVGYRFWGIFNGSIHLYNEIIYGAANPVGVTIRPMGLFSGGLGLEIPLGGPDLILDSQWLFTGPSSPNGGVISYARQSKIGVSFRLSQAWRVHVFSRTIRNFTDRAQELTEYKPFIDDPNTRFSMIGIGTSLRF